MELMHHMRNLSLIVLVVLMSACAPKNFAQQPRAPDGPPEYKQGWQDGCESGYSTYGNSFYKTFYHYKMDPQLRDNDIYYRTWSDAFNYCRAWVKHDQVHGLNPVGGFNPRDPDPFTDLRDPRPITDPQTFSFPLWNNDTNLPTFGDDGRNLWDGGSFD